MFNADYFLNKYTGNVKLRYATPRGYFIEATGNLQGLSTDCDTAFTAVVSEDDFKDALGKALYSVESQGYDFTTSDVYDEAVKGFEGISLRRQFQKIYISPQVNVSVKIA